jgi:CheY-like chemotaxis protein
MERILLILESDVTQELLTTALSGYEVRSCSADEASIVLNLFQPDALVLDLFLPGTDGFTLLENCQALLPPVVLPLSVLVTEYVQWKAASLGAGFVLPKPCSVDHIVNRLTDMLLFQRIPEQPDNSTVIDDFLGQFPLHGKPRLLSALCAAILMTIQDPDCLLTKDIYPVLCKAYGSSPDALDQAIRRLLRNAWKQREQYAAVWNTVFPGCTSCPSNGEFIIAAALFLRKKYPSRFRKGS